MNDRVFFAAPVLNYNNDNTELLLVPGWHLLENKQISQLKYSLAAFTLGNDRWCSSSASLCGFD